MFKKKSLNFWKVCVYYKVKQKQTNLQKYSHPSSLNLLIYIMSMFNAESPKTASKRFKF